MAISIWSAAACYASSSSIKSSFQAAIFSRWSATSF